MDQGRAVPEGFLDRPDPEAHLVYVWDAFSELGTERAQGMEKAGPVPFSAIDRYAARYGIDDPEEFERFRYLIRCMDVEALKAGGFPDGGKPVEVPISDTEGVRSLFDGLGARMGVRRHPG